MKEIVIYGIYYLELRRKIESFLNDEYRIVGYMDTYLSEDIVDGMEYIPIDKISAINPDYIVVCVRNTQAFEDIKQLLINVGGIEENRIINPIFLKSEKYMQKDLVRHIEHKLGYDTQILIFGLSYSLRGIVKNKLKYKAFDFSWHGLNLYYNYKLLLYARESQRFNRTKYSVCVFPYWYFNYDMSKSKYQYETAQILAVHRLQDYHNRDSVNGINDYEINEKLFASKFLDYYRPTENIYLYNSICSDKEDLPRIWTDEHHDTICENRKIYKKFIDELLSFSERVVLIIPPVYVGNINNIGIIEKMKSYFADIIGYANGRVVVLDLFSDERYQDASLFANATHLNYRGALTFTQHINDIINLLD